MTNGHSSRTTETHVSLQNRLMLFQQNTKKKITFAVGNRNSYVKIRAILSDWVIQTLSHQMQDKLIKSSIVKCKI